jgi:hypothetical protein
MPSPLSKKRRWAGRILSAVLLRGRLTALVGELTGSPSARPAVRAPLTPTVIYRV